MLLRDFIIKSQGSNRPVSLIFIDIDDFKNINDNFGHLVGDQVLTSVSFEVRRNIRNTDIAARYGGEEIIVLLYGANIEEARDRADKLRECIDAHEFIIRKTKDQIKVTISAGVSEYCFETADTDVDNIVSNLISHADSALYLAKKSGKNRVCASNYVIMHKRAS